MEVRRIPVDNGINSREKISRISFVDAIFSVIDLSRFEFFL
jgi:hypothetical protein